MRWAVAWISLCVVAPSLAARESGASRDITLIRTAAAQYLSEPVFGPLTTALARGPVLSSMESAPFLRKQLHKGHNDFLEALMAALNTGNFIVDVATAGSEEGLLLATGEPIGQLALQWLAMHAWRDLARRPGNPILNPFVRYEPFFDFLTGLYVASAVSLIPGRHKEDQALGGAIAERLADDLESLAVAFDGLDRAPLGAVLRAEVINEIRWVLKARPDFARAYQKARTVLLKRRLEAAAAKRVERAFAELAKAPEPIFESLLVEVTTGAQTYFAPLAFAHLLRERLENSDSPLCRRVGGRFAQLLSVCSVVPNGVGLAIRSAHGAFRVGWEGYRRSLARDLARRYPRPVACPLALTATSRG